MRTEKQNKDTRKKSLSEALLNSFGGYPIGYAIGIVILPLSVGWIQEDPFSVNLFITFIYATVSFVRTYFLRRLFDKLGFDDNFIRLAIKLYCKTFNKISIKNLLASDNCRLVVLKFKESIYNYGIKIVLKTDLLVNHGVKR